jgi:hypothetical protein
MIADARLNAGRFRAPADDAVSVLLEEGIGCKLASLAAGGSLFQHFRPRRQPVRVGQRQ